MKVRKIVVSALCGFALVSCTQSPARAELKLGDQAPMSNVKMKNVDGKEVSIAGVAGKNGTLVIFSCNACPFVVAWEQRVATIGNTYRKKGIGVIQINSNDPAVQPPDGYEQMKARAKERGFRFPYAVDATSEVAGAFGATRTPEAFLFDKEGKLVYHGTIDDNYQSADNVKSQYLRDALESLLAGKDIEVKETKAVGCTIKWRPKA